MIIRRFAACLMVAPAVLVLGCTSGTGKQTMKEPTQPKETMQSTAKEVSQAAETFQEKRQEYIDAAETRLNRVEADIVQLKTQTPNNPYQRRNQEEIVDALESRLSRVRGRVDRLAESSANNWQRRQTQVEESMKRLEANLETVKTGLAH